MASAREVNDRALSKGAAHEVSGHFVPLALREVFSKRTIPRRWLAAMLAMVCLLNAFAVAQSTRPAQNVADQSVETQSLRISPTDVQAASAKPISVSSLGSNSSDLTRIIIALASVIGLILLMRAFYRRVSGAAGSRGSKLVTVLSRSFISPKQQVLVLEIGKRLLVVGDSGGHMNSLCEITDPDEIATLIGRSRSASSAKGSNAFASVFKRANESFDEPIAAEVATDREALDPDESVSAAEIGGLLDKVRLLQQQFNENKQVRQA